MRRKHFPTSRQEKEMRSWGAYFATQAFPDEQAGKRNAQLDEDFLIGVYMSKEILINSGIREVRAAVLTGGNGSEIF